MAIAESAVYVYSFLVGSASTRCEIVLSLANGDPVFPDDQELQPDQSKGDPQKEAV